MKMTWERSTKYEVISTNYPFWKAVRKKKSEETWMIQDIYRRTFKKITCFGIMEEECKKKEKKSFKTLKKMKNVKNLCCKL